MAITNKYKIADKEVGKALDHLNKKADEGVKGNFVIMSQPITPNDAGKLVEGKRYIDKQNKRVVIKLDNVLYGTDLTPL